jgi:hypothetical protein
MNTKAIVAGFVEYLQGVYGANGTDAQALLSPPNSLLVPMFVGADEEAAPDFGALGAAMGGQPDYGGLLASVDRVTGGAMGADPMMDPMMSDPTMGMLG